MTIINRTYTGDSVALEDVILQDFPGKTIDAFDLVNNTVTLDISPTLSAQEITDIEALIDSNPVTSLPKIIGLSKGEAASKHFHNINYIIDIDTSIIPGLYPKRTFIYGACTNVKWYADSDLTDLVIDVVIQYTYDSLGIESTRTVTRTYYRTDDTAHYNVKTTTKNYENSPPLKIKAAMARRFNNANAVEQFLIDNAPALTVADSLITNMTIQQVKDSLAVFWNNYDHEENMYIKTGSLIFEQAAEDEVDVQFNWFNTIATSLSITGVADIRDYMIYQLSGGIRNKDGPI